jgi:WD40 repeat protein
MRFIRYLATFLVLSCLCSREPVLAQTVSGPCSMPTFDKIVNEANIFSEQQEEWLGDILAPQIEVQFKKVADPGNDYLQRLGNRLLAQLPESKIHYRFTIIDYPDNQSFGIPGGNIYISRRIITLARTEDELAGLLGHEIGHIITRQPAITITRHMQDVLGVSKLGDQKDVQNKWNQLVDLAATKKVSYSEKREEAEQLIADRIAIYAMARAGYQPSQFVDFFDRLVQTRGKTGSFWTDLFGRTSSDSKRLRELLRNSVPLAQNCLNTSAQHGNEQFLQWQKAVIASDFVAAKEALPGLISKKTLNPPLRSDLRTLRYSPDGNYLLAQDENTIFVLTTHPVTNVFHVDAPDTYAPQFTPDSKAIVFYDKELRVQEWDVQGKRIFLHELASSTHCLETALSPTGEVFACLDDQLQPQLTDVSNSTLIHKGRKLHEPTRFEVNMAVAEAAQSGESFDLYPMRFSPDGHYFVVGHQNTAFAYDLKTNIEMDLPRKIKELAGGTFTFLSADEIAGYGSDGKKMVIARLRFPSGEMLGSVPWSPSIRLAPAEKGDFLLLMHSGEPAVTVFDWKTQKVAVMYKKPGFSVYGDVFAGETAGGEIGIYGMQDKKYQGGIDLPNGSISAMSARAFSPDGNWLALSQKTRGAVWNLTTGERTFLTRGFEGAFFEQDLLFAKFPGQGKDSAAVFKFDTSKKSLENLYALKPDPSMPDDNEALYWQQGELLLHGAWRPKEKVGARTQVEVLDIRTDKKLWERKPRRRLPFVVHSRLAKTVTLVVGDYEDMKADAKEDPVLSARLNALVDEKRRAASYIIEALDDSTGKELGKVLVDTGNLSFRVQYAVTVGDRVLVTDSEDRTLVYSLKTGEQKGIVPGLEFSVSADGAKLMVGDGKTKAELYDLATLQPLQHFEFPSPLLHVEFSADGKGLIALTNDQTIYRLKLDAQEKAAAPEKAAGLLTN